MDASMNKNNIFKLFKHNVLARFFIRLGVIFVTVTLLGLGGVYWYFEYENAKQIDVLINEQMAGFEKDLKVFDMTDPENDALIYKRLEELMQAHQMLIMQISDMNAKVLYAATGTEDKKVIQSFHDFGSKLSTEEDYRLIRTDPARYILVFTKNLSFNQASPVLIKVAIQLTSETVMAMRKGMGSVVIGTVIILLLVVLAIFPIIYRQYRQLELDKMTLLHSNLDIVRAMGDAVAMRDSDTSEHNYRVTYYSIKLAENMEIEPAQFPALIKGAFLHDVGKIGISDTVLLKPARLDENEFSMMKMHVELGLSLIKKIAWFDDASIIIGAHHEKFDGSGYPNGLKGDAIPLVARIFAVVDVFDALTSKRPYKEAFTFAHAMKLIQNESGKHFDPVIITSFLNIAESLWNGVANKHIDELEILLLEAVMPYVSMFENLESEKD